VVSETSFDYEAKVWGAPKVRLSPTYIQALKLKYCLEDLEGLSGRIVDIGCGAGNMPRAMKYYRPDLEVWGTDLSTHAVKAALEDPEGVRFLACDGERLPFRDGFFDAVTMFDVFEHFPDPVRALSEAHRVLRPGGLFHNFVPLEKQPYTIYALLHRLGWKAKEEHCGHIYFYSDRDCKNHMEQVGFEVKRLRWSIHPIYAMVDVAYFTFLSIRGKPVSTSVEGFIHRHNGKPSLTQRFVGLLKNVLVAMGYYESLALRWMPGGGGHFTGVKR
jgi:SAM-dependent methyltransferase